MASGLRGYCNNVLVFSRTKEEHAVLLDEIFE